MRTLTLHKDLYGGYMYRTLCDVLEEMRRCAETMNFAPIKGLIEEAQGMGNRMEAGLSDKKEIGYYRDQLSETKDEVEKLQNTKKELEKAVDELKTVIAKATTRGKPCANTGCFNKATSNSMFCNSCLDIITGVPATGILP